MIKEFAAFFELFKEGKALINAAEWKNRQLIGNHLFAFLSSAVFIAGCFGYTINIDAETLKTAAFGIGALYSVGTSIFTVITSEKVGISGIKKK